MKSCNDPLILKAVLFFQRVLLISCKLWEASPTSQISQVPHVSITLADKAESHQSPSGTSEEGGSSAKTCQGGTNRTEKKKKGQDLK